MKGFTKKVRETFQDMGILQKTHKVRFSNSAKNRKTRKSASHMKSSSGSSRASRSSKSRSTSGSFETRSKKKFIRDFRKKTIDVDKLVGTVEDLFQSSQVFKKKNAKRKSPNSPILLSVKNLDNGKVAKATVIKDLNTGKYDFIELSGSK